MSGGPAFRSGHCDIPGWKGKKFRLDRSTWKFKTSKPEREHLQYNWGIVLEACATPTIVRRSTKNDKSLLFYRACSAVKIRRDVEVPFTGFLVVVVLKEKWIQTIYFTKKVKQGEVIHGDPGQI